MKQPKNRDFNFSNQKEINEIFESARKRIAQDPKQMTATMTPKVLQKRLRRISRLCQDMIKHCPDYKYFTTYTVLLKTNDHGNQVVEIKFNGVDLPGHIRLVKREIPLHELQDEVKRMAEKVRSNKLKQENEIEK